MDRKDVLRKIWAGSFFLTGLLMIVVVVLVIGIEKGLTEPRFGMRVLFREVGGLSIGAPVNLSGVSVGTVGSIDFLQQEIDGRGVVVTLNIFKKFEPQMKRASRFAIKTAGILGEKSVEISRDFDNIPIDIAQPVIGEDPLDVQDLAKIFGDTAIALQETTKLIHSIVTELQDISVTTKRLLNRIEQRIIDGNLFKVF